MTLEFSRNISEKLSNIIKIRPVGVDFFHADGQKAGRMDIQNEVTSSFSQFSERDLKSLQ